MIIAVHLRMARNSHSSGGFVASSCLNLNTKGGAGGNEMELRFTRIPSLKCTTALMVK